MGVVTTLNVAKATVGHVVATSTKKNKKKQVAVERAAGGGGRVLGSVHALAHEMETARPDDGRYHHSTVHSDSLHDAADEAAAGDEASGVLVEGELEHKTLVMRCFKKKVLQLHSCGDFYVKGRSGGFLLYEPKSQVRARSLSLSLACPACCAEVDCTTPVPHPPTPFLPFPSPPLRRARTRLSASSAVQTLNLFQSCPTWLLLEARTDALSTAQWRLAKSASAPFTPSLRSQ